MVSDAENDLFLEGENHFKENQYECAEPILNQLVLRGSKRPEVFHMLGTIYYDHGKFNKALRSFRRALEIDPAFTDSSIGLSIILNDLGRYDEGQKVFDEARAMLSVRAQKNDHNLGALFSQKHDELGELYLRHEMYTEALEQFTRAQKLSPQRREALALSMAECHARMHNLTLAIRELRLVARDYPGSAPIRLMLGKLYYDSHQIPEAIEQWESVLAFEPENPIALDYLRLAKTIQVTHLHTTHHEL